jgi:hypothetical protein
MTNYTEHGTARSNTTDSDSPRGGPGRQRVRDRLDALVGRIFWRRLNWEFSQEVLNFIEEGELPRSAVNKPLPVTHKKENVLSVKAPDGQQLAMAVQGAELGGTPFWEEVRIAFEIEPKPKPVDVGESVNLFHSSVLYFTFSSIVSFERNLQNLADYTLRQKDGLRSVSDQRWLRSSQSSR